MKRLPAELTDIIIGFLSSERYALLACSLVCKGWLPASRRHLFSTIVLTGSVERARILVELLTTPGPLSTIARYVHTVSLQHIRDRTQSQALSTIVQPLEKLVCVETLILEGCWSFVQRREPEVKHISMWFAKITTLHLRVWSLVFDFFHFLSLFPSLRVLHLQTGQKISSDHSHVLRFPSGLRVIDIRCGGGEIHWLFSVEDLAMSELRLSQIGIQDLPLLQRLFHSCGNSIQFLHMSLSQAKEVVRMLHEYSDLSCLSNLQVLRVDLRWIGSEHLFGLVSQITSEHMTEIILQLSCPSNEVAHRFTFMDWMRLDLILSHPRFARLQRVEIILGILYIGPCGSLADDCVRGIRREMGGLDSRGCLFVSVLDGWKL